MMAIAIRFAVLLLAGSLACGSAVARESTSDRRTGAEAECPQDSATGSRIKRNDCEVDDRRGRPVRERKPTDQVADALKQDAASGSTLTRAQTN